LKSKRPWEGVIEQVDWFKHSLETIFIEFGAWHGPSV